MQVSESIEDLYIVLIHMFKLERLSIQLTIYSPTKGQLKKRFFG